MSDFEMLGLYWMASSASRGGLARVNIHPDQVVEIVDRMRAAETSARHWKRLARVAFVTACVYGVALGTLAGVYS